MSLAASALQFPACAQSTLSGKRIQPATLPPAALSATGTPSSTTYLRGDWTWATPTGASDHQVALSGTDAAPGFLDAKVGVSGPLTISDISGVRVIGMGAAGAGANGYLLGSDWSIFNAKEPGLGNPSASGYVLSSTTAGVRSWIVPASGATGAQGPTGATGATGATGPAGASGTNGTNGTNGAAATVAVGTTTTLAAGSSATVTNSGTTTSAVLNFGIPAGTGGGGGVSVVTALPAASISTQGSLYLVRGNGSADDSLFVGIQRTGSSKYRFGLIVPASYSFADPSDVSGLVLWLNAANITGVANGGNVTSWADASTFSNNASAPGNAPTYVSSAVNGLPALRFTAASSQKLQVANSASIALTAGFTLFVVVKPASLPASGGYGDLLSKYDNGNQGYDFRLFNNSGTQDLDAVAGSTFSNAKTLSTTAYSLLEWRYDGTTLTLKVNGVQVGSTTSFSVTADTKALNIGGFGFYTPSSTDLGRYFDGFIPEIALYSNGVTAGTGSNEASLQAYFSSRYALGF